MIDDLVKDHPPLPDRACGECSVCCVALTIDEPGFRKVQGYRCPNLRREGGCGIYESRPHTCGAFFCGWRLLKWVRPTLRPDRSGVLIELHGEIAADGTKRLGVSFTLLNRAGLKAEGLAESLAAAVRAKIPVFLVIPGPPGYTAAIAKINAELEDAVQAKNKADLLRIVGELHAQGRRGARVPVNAMLTAGVDGMPPGPSSSSR